MVRRLGRDDWVLPLVGDWDARTPAVDQLIPEVAQSAISSGQGTWSVQTIERQLTSLGPGTQRSR